MNFGERIKQLRRERGWTQAEFAEKMGMTERHIIRWEKSQNRPTGRTLEKMAELLGLSLEEMFVTTLPSVQTDEPENVLLHQFKEIQQLEEHERQAISLVIDAFLTKRRMSQVLQQVAHPSKRSA